MNHVIVYADPSGVWNFRAFDSQGTLIADGAMEGYDTYDTVMGAVGNEFPGALVATNPVDLSPEPAMVDAAATDGALS